jgi:hypothetical protein
MLPDARHAKTLVVVQGLTRQAVRYLHFSSAGLFRCPGTGQQGA